MPLDLPTTGPLIGRAGELDRLARLAGADGSGHRPGVVLLSGDAGIGKTRLVTALGERAREAGWRVVVGHCLDVGDSALPYLPFSELFGRLDTEAPALADSVAAAYPPLRRLMPGRRPPTAETPQDASRIDRTELFEAAHAALEHLGRAAPLLLVFEDVHWADQSTRDLLGFLFARRFEAPVSVVASYRSDDLHRRHPLRPVVAQWTRLPGLERVDLGPLSDADVRRLVRALHPAALRESAVHTVVQRAEGNAFFTEELVAATAVGDGALPRDLAGLLLVRLDQLDDPARHVVRAASAAGRQVSHQLLSRVVDLEGTELDLALRAAVESNVLLPVGPDGYAFRHAMLSEAVYDDLLPGERVRLHAAYVAALTGQDVEGTAAELARHARAAHDSATALRASVQAGDDAFSVAGPDEALRHYELALELSTDDASSDGATGDGGAGDGATDVNTLTVKANAAAIAAGRLDKALALVQDRLRRLSPEAPPSQRSHLLLALASTILLSDVNVDPLAATGEALRLVPAEPPTALRCRVLSVHAQALADLQRDEEATRWGQEALELARRLGLRDVAADATTTLARLQERGGDPEASRVALEQIIDEAHARRDSAELRGLHHLGSLHLEQGRLTDALAAYQRGAARAREIGRPWAPYGLDARVLAGLVAYQSGDWDASERIVDVGGQAPPAMAEAALAAVTLCVAAGRGETRALELMSSLRPWWDSDGMIAIISGGAAIDLHGDAGSLDAAQAAHDDTVACVSELWQLPDFLARVRLSALLLGHLAAHAHRAGTAERAELARRGDELVGAAGRAAAPSARRVRRRGPEADAWLQRAEAEHLRLRWLTGVDVPPEGHLVEAWQDCVAAFERYPHVFEHARSQARLAAVLRSVGSTARARDTADHARATAHRLGAHPLLAELRGLGAVGPAHRADGPVDGVLTQREQEVLALVAEGRSNRQIAGQLYISAKTVSVHVSNILAKLAVEGRTEAVAVARRRGLLAD